MDLKTAQRKADKIVEWLSPFCERIEAAGSIRRRRPNCADIDLVAVPKITESTDLLGNVDASTNHLFQEFTRYATRNAVHWVTGKGNPGSKAFVLESRGVQLDIWIATHAGWGSVMLSRTGSATHNIQLAARAREMGMHWSVQHGILKDQKVVAGLTEELMFEALSLPFVHPEKREVPCNS